MSEKIITIEEMLGTPITVIANYSVERLYQLMKQADERLSVARRHKQWLESAIRLKYEERVRAKRMRLEKDSGVVHIEEDGFKLTADVTKKVDWDQRELQKIIADLLAKGVNLDDFVETSYKVTERKFSSWSESVRNVFLPARTVRFGSSKFALSKLDTEVVL